MKIKDLLPIGSVVLLSGGQKKLMVFGVKQTDNSDGKDYDYIGVLYPEGNMGEGSQFLFNHDDIEQVYFHGFEDEERENFMVNLTQYFEQNSQNGE